MSDSSFKTIQDYTGPRRVKTKEVEVEAHDPLTVQRLSERRKNKRTLLSQFAYTQVKPKHSNCLCRDIDDPNNCVDDAGC